MDDIAEGSGALMCYTDKVDCCGGSVNMRQGDWYYPDGLQVHHDGAGGSFYRNRSYSVVRLHRRENTVMPIGIFHCEIPDKNGTNQSIYVGVYPQGQGNN